MMGACTGFLWWNAPPARIFMGDTGSLAIGAGLAGLALTLSTSLLLPDHRRPVRGRDACRSSSRSFSFRTFGRRVFRMAPIHHHYELRGWPETTVLVRFWIIAGLATALALGMFYADFTSLSGVPTVSRSARGHLGRADPSARRRLRRHRSGGGPRPGGPRLDGHRGRRSPDRGAAGRGGRRRRRAGRGARRRARCGVSSEAADGVVPAPGLPERHPVFALAAIDGRPGPQRARPGRRLGRPALRGDHRHQRQDHRRHAGDRHAAGVRVDERSTPATPRCRSSRRSTTRPPTCSWSRRRRSG